MATDREIAHTPDSIRIGPYTWAIEYDGQTCYDFDWSGVCLNRSKRIVLDPRQSDTEIRQTAMHEVLHAIGLSNEIPMVGSHTVDPSTQRPTDKIDALASALLVFMRDNPAFVAWVREAP